MLKVLIHQCEGVSTKPKFFPELVLIVEHPERENDLSIFFQTANKDGEAIKKLLKANRIGFHEHHAMFIIFPSHVKAKDLGRVTDILAKNGYIDSTLQTEMKADIKDCYQIPPQIPTPK